MKNKMMRKTEAKPKWNKDHVKGLMRQVLAGDYCIDGRTGEVNSTELAELVCADLEAWGPPPTYDCPEDFFDWAIDVAIEYEESVADHDGTNDGTFDPDDLDDF